MGRALQRLLVRPSSVELLRCLIRKESVGQAPLRLSNAHHRSQCFQCRQHTLAAATQAELDEHTVSVADDSLGGVLKGRLQRGPTGLLKHLRDAKLPHISNKDDNTAALPNSTCTTGRERAPANGTSPQNDLKRWASLIETRLHHQGNKGVKDTWDDLQARGAQIPTDEPLGTIFWPLFLDVGFQSELFLNEIIHHADELCERFGKHWPELYLYIMRHMVLKGKKSEVLHWHERLIRNHRPSEEIFQRLLHEVISKQGDQRIIQMLYTKINHRHLYSTIVPILTDRRDFESALSWHSLLVRHGDHPSRLKLVEPLIRYYALIEPRKAIDIKSDLVDAGLSFASKVSIQPSNNEIISRERMNLIHGATFGIHQKKYNDGLGARWLATRWVSLDLAISTLHALGVESIGPLSLQAIALREDTPKGIIHRMDQLRELGISVGNSVFSKAVESFARKQEVEYLAGILRSDQHPDSLEDWKVQEALLAFYARAGDWAQFRRTMAIRLLESCSPVLDQRNIELRVYVTNGDRIALLRTLEEMRISGLFVKPITVRYMLHEALSRRRKGRAPNTYEPGFLDLNTTISILKDIAKANKLIPADAWQGILRRLGMLGRLDELERLCLWLLDCHKSDWGIPTELGGTQLRPPVVGRNSRPAARFPPFQRLHPLRTLFSDDFQQAVAEWGFIHQPIYQPSQLRGYRAPRSATNSTMAHHYTRGLRLLRLLQSNGVLVGENGIRRAVLNRLALLHGPRESKSTRNRILKQQNNISLEDMVEQINKDWGEELLPDMEVVIKRVYKA